VNVETSRTEKACNVRAIPLRLSSYASRHPPDQLSFSASSDRRRNNPPTRIRIVGGLGVARGE